MFGGMPESKIDKNIRGKLSGCIKTMQPEFSLSKQQAFFTPPYYLVDGKNPTHKR
jgi:hypothetical protein